MFPQGPRKARRLNNPDIPKFSKQEKCSLHATNKLFASSKRTNSLNFNENCWTQLDMSSTIRPNARSIATDVKSRKDVYSLRYQPTTQRFKTLPAGYFEKQAKIFSNKTQQFTYKQNKCASGSNNSLPSTSGVPDNKSGRISQLANRVERLLIQDSTNTVHRNEISPLFCHSKKSESHSATLDSLEVSFPTDLKKNLNGCVSSPVKSTLSSPWYRHCRPKAPPPSLPLFTENNDLKCCEDGNRDFKFCGSSNRGDLLEVECENFFNSLPCLLPSVFSYSVQSPSISVLETGISQENINWHSDLQSSLSLPSPSNTDVTLMSRSYSLPPPPNENIDEESNMFSGSVIYPEEDILKPLVPITNILSNGGALIRRHPKWAVKCNSDAREFRTTVRLPDINPTVDFDFDSPPSIPSPPPLILEYLPSEAYMSKSPKQHSICPSTLNNPNLARPIFLKRGASYGEQTFSNTIGFASGRECDQPLTMKRNLYWDPSNVEYSPKKSRVQLLVPSECSAFLPVRSNRQLHRQHSLYCISPSRALLT
ncbi:hypothetical protein KSF78_0006309 [Schistosoma japonicum]|nr:hypothetical protein KSF78_0006309 [Schistosoma japonicum]